MYENTLSSFAFQNTGYGHLFMLYNMPNILTKRFEFTKDVSNDIFPLQNSEWIPINYE